MRAVRVLLVVAGTALVGYGGWLLWPHLPASAAWLLAGPVVHDAVVAPLVSLAGLLLGRALPDRVWRAWVVAGLTLTALLMLIALPLIWRPDPAAPNPGLQDRDYLTALAVWLAVLWTGVLVGAGIGRVRDRRSDETAGAAPADWPRRP